MQPLLTSFLTRSIQTHQCLPRSAKAPKARLADEILLGIIEHCSTESVLELRLASRVTNLLILTYQQQLALLVAERPYPTYQAESAWIGSFSECFALDSRVGLMDILQWGVANPVSFALSVTHSIKQ